MHVNSQIFPRHPLPSPQLHQHYLGKQPDLSSVWSWDSDISCAHMGQKWCVHNLSPEWVIATDAKQIIVLQRQHASRGYRCSDEGSVCVCVHVSLWVSFCLLGLEQDSRRGASLFAKFQWTTISTSLLACPSSPPRQRLFFSFFPELSYLPSSGQNRVHFVGCSHLAEERSERGWAGDPGKQVNQS